MPRIRTSNATKGRPGFKRVTFSGFTGRRVSKDTSGTQGVRRFFARDPAKKNSLIGTSKDVNPNAMVNTVGQQNPTIIKAPHDQKKRLGAGAIKVAARNVNRSVKKR